MENAAAAAAGTGSTFIGNVHSLAAFIPTFDGSYPVQDFFEEIKDAIHVIYFYPQCLKMWNLTVSFECCISVNCLIV